LWSRGSEPRERRFESCRPDSSCRAARRSCHPLLTGGVQVRVLPGQPIDRDVLLGEQCGSNPHAEGSTPSVLALVSVAEQPRHHLARVDRRVRPPPDTFAMVSWSSGVLATLTWWRTLVRIQPGLLTVTPVAQRQRHPVHIRANAGSSPAGSSAEWTGARIPAQSHKLSDVGSNPTSATIGGARAKGARVLRRHPGWVRFPSSPLQGPVVQREDVGLACRRCGFDSRRVHSPPSFAVSPIPWRLATEDLIQA
jgi:hypothetical protein